MLRLYIICGRIINKLKKILYHKIAIYKLKRAKVIFSNDIIFNGKTYLSLSGTVSIGKNFICNSTIKYCIDHGFTKIVVKEGARLQIGDNCGISNLLLHCYNNIIIGNYVNIGAGTMIFDTNFHSTDWRKRKSRIEDTSSAKEAPIHIGDNVFIGTHCIIGKGISIGENSIIAAGSVVVRNVPAGEIWGGNPAIFIKKIEQ
jgi:acetyltransferase-like isoleucine patch superfamily enzyme